MPVGRILEHTSNIQFLALSPIVVIHGGRHVASDYRFSADPEAFAGEFGINGRLLTATPGTGEAVKVLFLHQSYLGTISGIPNRLLRNLLLRGFELLEADNVGLSLTQPAQQHRKASIDAIHIVGGNPQLVCGCH